MRRFVMTPADLTCMVERTLREATSTMALASAIEAALVEAAAVAGRLWRGSFEQGG
jgi:hypothetical protein